MDLRVNWYYDDFMTLVNEISFRFIVKQTIGGFEAQAYMPRYSGEDLFCNDAFSRISMEDAMFKLVSKLEIQYDF